MIQRQTVLFLGISQLVCWGISYYLIAVFGEMISFELGWSGTVVYGGFSAALVIMAVTSPFTGRLIDVHGGRSIMTIGSFLLALGCFGIASAHSIPHYYLSWMVLGVAMRLTLYDAAFASLVHIAGANAKLPKSQVTLLGGLASTVFWPIGFFLADFFGWRGALGVYSFIALLTIPLHLAIPKDRGLVGMANQKSAIPHPLPLAQSKRARTIAGSLFVLIFTLLNFLNSAMSAHMINLLAGLGLTAALSVWVSALRGVGQSFARLCEVLFGRRLHSLTLTVFASSLLLTGFLFGLLSGRFLAMALIFSFLFGAGNGLLTIARGSLPLVLFETATYGAFVGKLLVPGFLFSAIAPLVYTWIIDYGGEQAALIFSTVLAFFIFSCSLLLNKKFSAANKSA
ncbi:MFS transporter [Metaplanococcus flavidus]|uniref:MFS transporter n=1 Tax=Metaplanococcus flavidus TaxID=569883 RepID=A0ABW3LAP0_9BACL